MLALPASARTELLLGVGFLGAALLGWALHLGDAFITFWPANGILLATLLLSPRERWLRLLATVFAVNTGFNWFMGLPPLPALLYALANVFEGALGATLIRRHLPAAPTLQTLREVGIFGLFGAVLAPAIAALLGAAAATALVGGPGFGGAWLEWWAADTLGVGTAAPVVLTWVGRSDRRALSEAPREWLAFAVLLLAIPPLGGIGLPRSLASLAVLPVLSVPISALCAWRLGPRVTAIALFLINLVTLWNLHAGQGHLVEMMAKPGGLALIQMILAGLEVTALLMAAGLLELDRKAAALQASHEREAEQSRALARLVDELRVAHAEAEAAGRAKADFLATMSHEIRTPMSAVIGMNEILLESDLDPDQRDAAETVRRSAESLLGVLNDVLDFSKIEAGKLVLERIPFGVRDCVLDVLEMLTERAECKGIALVADFADSSPELVVGDPDRVRQVLTNLVGNAVKFTERGEVEVSVEASRATAAGAEPSDVDLCFAVRDTGVGVPREAQAILFSPFQQADASTTRRFGGTGLGLTISRRLVEAMGGSIGFTSEPGRGSTFQFRIPVQPAEVAESEPAVPPTAGVRAYVDVPHPLERRALLRTLRRLGVEGVALEDVASRSAVPASSVAAEVAILDLPRNAAAWPERVAELARRLPLPVPVIGLRPVRRLREHGDGSRGVAVLVRKPVREANLSRAICESLGRPSHSARAAAPWAGANVLAGVRVLVAEDNHVSRKVVVHVLGRLGCEVHAVENGVEALRLLEARHFDVVLMDCQMPEMDGYQATAEIRRRESGGARTPIVALTAHALGGDRDRCLQAGMDDYLSKPLRIADLVEVIGRWIARPKGLGESSIA